METTSRDVKPQTFAVKFQPDVNTIIFMWDIPVCGEYKLVQIIVNHTQ